MVTMYILFMEVRIAHAHTLNCGIEFRTHEIQHLTFFINSTVLGVLEYICSCYRSSLVSEFSNNRQEGQWIPK